MTDKTQEYREDARESIDSNYDKCPWNIKSFSDSYVAGYLAGRKKAQEEIEGYALRESQADSLLLRARDGIIMRDKLLEQASELMLNGDSDRMLNVRKWQKDYEEIKSDR